jgi:hypothetical protein
VRARPLRVIAVAAAVGVMACGGSQPPRAASPAKATATKPAAPRPASRRTAGAGGGEDEWTLPDTGDEAPETQDEGVPDEEIGAPAAPADRGPEVVEPEGPIPGDRAPTQASPGRAPATAPTDDRTATSGGSGAQSLRIDDELDDVGPDATITDEDLTTAETSSGDGAPRTGTTQLDTLAMAYTRIGFDLAQDEVPPPVSGIDVVGEEVLSFRAHGRAEGTTRFGRRIKVKVAGRADAEYGIDENTNRAVERYEAQIWDTYADLYGDWADVRFGKQIVSWGVADLLSPNDVVNARDLRRGFLERPEELRIPALALSATAYKGPLSLQALWIPVAPAHRFELVEGDYAMFGANAATDAERRVGAIGGALAGDPRIALALGPLLAAGDPPDNGIRTSEVGGSLALRFKKVDFAAYGLWGHERSPRLQAAAELGELFMTTPPDMLTPDVLAAKIEELAAEGTPPVIVDYPRRIHVGGAIAGRLEPLGIKLEGAYSPETVAVIVPPGAGPLLSQPRSLPQLGGTVSVDYDRGDRLTIVLEGSHVRVLDVPADRAVFQMDGDQLWLVGGRMEWSPWSDLISLRFLGFVDVTSPSYALRPAIRLSGHDNLSAELALTLYGGDPGTFGGIADRNDAALLTVQYGL